MKQITIVTEVRNGLTADLAELLGNEGINIESLSADEVGDTAVIKLSVNKYDEALHVLNQSGYEAVTEDALILRVKDEPGALAKVARRFSDANLHVSSIKIIRRRQGWGLVAIATERTEEAIELVRDIDVGDSFE